MRVGRHVGRRPLRSGSSVSLFLRVVVLSFASEGETETATNTKTQNIQTKQKHIVEKSEAEADEGWIVVVRCVNLSVPIGESE